MTEPQVAKTPPAGAQIAEAPIAEPQIAETPGRIEPRVAELPARAKPSLRERFKSLMAEYGRLALYVYFAIFALVILSFAAAIKFGFRADGAAATAGTWGAAWLATKLTQPLRIAATLVLTPVVGGLLRKFSKRRG